MGKFVDNAITQAGRQLLTDVQLGGAELDVTRIVMGAGYMPAGMTAAYMTEVVAPIISLPVNKKERRDDGRIIFGGYYSNKDITEEFKYRELALMARAIYRDENGIIISTTNEVVYSYGNAGDDADTMPAYTSGEAIERQIDLLVWIGNETQVNLIIESGVYVTHQELNQAISDSEARMIERMQTILIPIGDRLDVAELEIEALKANDTFIHGRLNEVAAQTTAVWDAFFNDIIENPAIVDFDDLTGITLSGGVWNRPLRRLEV